jgi:MoaA/NifB/PqqE/SkfB family radical SAM enzyme
MHMFLDVVGSCNLKCPSCPVGNSINANSKKPMPAELFGQIVKKAAHDGVRSLHLYNWTEPLVHPKIGEFIHLVESSGMECGISSNLNVAKNMESAIRANPSFFRISLSGFTQDVYGLGHAGGDIAVVKENMIRLAELKASLNAKTDIEVYYHRYLDNVDEESKMREFSEKLGFRFSAAFATLMPLEKTLAVVENDGSISQSDRQVMSRLALPPSPDVIDITRRHKNVSCGLKDEMITLDCEGNAILCCSVFEQKKYSVGNYLELSLPEIQSRKNTMTHCQSMCDRCTSHGLHVYAQTPNQGPLLKRAVENSISFHARRLGSSIQQAVEASAVDGVEDFDESAYLAENVDVATAVVNGVFRSGLQHYLSYGRDENRPGTPKRV